MPKPRALDLVMDVTFLRRFRAPSNAARMIRAQPRRVKTAVCSAVSCGVPGAQIVHRAPRQAVPFAGGTVQREGGVGHANGLVDHLGSDAVAADDCDARSCHCQVVPEIGSNKGEPGALATGELRSLTLPA